MATNRPVTAVEVHSIDYIPHEERHGKAWHQAPFWFAGNFLLVTIAVGFIGPSMGLSVGWSIIGAILGNLFGTFFVACHANQGPRLGLPQMIQSRAQFGSRGAALPFFIAVCIYIGFGVFNIIAAAQAFQVLVPMPTWAVYVLFFAIAALLAVVGHDLLHVVQRWNSYVLVIVFTIITIYALTTLHIGSATPHAGFTATAFFVQFATIAAFQISYAIFVSDYSRYLPPTVSSAKVIGWTYLGMFASTAWMAGLGSILAASLAKPDPILSVQQIGNQMVPGFGTFAVLISVPVLISITSVEFYGATLTAVSGIDAFKKISPTLRVRVVGVLVITLVTLLLTLLTPSNFLGSFNNFLTLLLTALIPWTSINLVDFYLIRHGKYTPSEIVNPRGMYGLWGWRALGCYGAGLLAMVPFVNQAFYEGPLSKAMGGVDISFVVGILVAGLTFFAFGRTSDVAAIPPSLTETAQ